MSRPSPNPTQQAHVIEAIAQSDRLSGMLSLHHTSQKYLNAAQTLLPSALFSQIKAGPLDDTGWCLLVNHNAAAAKLRQLLPDLAAHLRSHGHPVDKIRIKVLTR